MGYSSYEYSDSGESDLFNTISRQEFAGIKKDPDEVLELLTMFSSQDECEYMAGEAFKAGASVTAKNKDGNNILHLAINRGYQCLVRPIVQAGSNVNVKNRAGQTPIFKVAARGWCYEAQFLISRGAKVNVVDTQKHAPITEAVINGQIDMVRTLIGAGAKLNKIGQAKLSLVHLAVANRQLEIAKVLIKAGAEVDGAIVDSLVTVANDKRNQNSITETFTLLTDAGATVDGATAKINPLVPSDVIRAIVPKDTPFWLAANNDAPMLAAELAGGLDPNMKTENGTSLLHWACAGDAPECVLLLLEAGADKEAGDPVFYCMHKSSQCLECFINYGIDVNRKYARLGFLIQRAITANSPACVTALVGAGAWVTKEKMGENSQSPIFTALYQTPVPLDVLQALLTAAGEQVLSEENDECAIPIYFAAQYCDVKVVQMLVEAGANVHEDCQVGDEWFRDVLEYAEYALPQSYSPSEAARLMAIIKYLKKLPTFSKHK